MTDLLSGSTIAQHCLDHGALYPYDNPDDCMTPAPSIDWAHAAARGILSDLTDRRGIKWTLQEIEQDVRAELVSSLADIIRLAASVAICVA